MHLGTQELNARSQLQATIALQKHADQGEVERLVILKKFVIVFGEPCPSHKKNGREMG